jgi:hypothetical protein
MAIEEVEGKSAKCAVACSEASRNPAEVEALRRAMASDAAASRTVAAAFEASAFAASAASVAFVVNEELGGVAPGALAIVVVPWWAIRDRISPFYYFMGR